MDSDLCEAGAETAQVPDVLPDLHWCLLDEGHLGGHVCPCGLEWAEEVTC